MTETHVPFTHDTAPATAPVDFYDVLGLDRDDSTEVLARKLRTLAVQWAARASRAGAVGKEGRDLVTVISAAEEAFSSEDARERYDLGLIRRPAQETAAAPLIDWQSRAWTYYFLGDFGAAAVAARKAREVAPDDPMTFVITAWVQISEDELKQAKQSADEAFVLDELGEDTADVHHVRGLVFYLNGDFDRAIQGFDRALAKAGDGEKPEILLRKAWAHSQKGEANEMLRTAENGLSLGVEMAAPTQRGLEEAICRAVYAQSDDPAASAASITRYRSAGERIGSSATESSSKARVLAFIEERCRLHTRLLETIARITELEAASRSLTSVPAPEGAQTNVPLIPIGIGLVMLVAGTGWAPLALVGLAFLAYAGFAIAARVRWNAQKEAFTTARRDLASVQRRLADERESRTEQRDHLTPFTPLAS
ncbi:tetratricopeptide repeat protein [Rathayibacter sp. Leaf296]|uniref:tetratricopeptide repeat protein n=1 Tax=Rathayibacter sp. Leaf296 TaxID=1736327 RepID=UPI000ACE0948|nr:tetratricopeptide repeat protein [Rathayibacter sp. Leaf296]